MIYSKVEIDANSGLPNKCPRCDNENVAGAYCNTCGTYMFNECTGFEMGEKDQYRQIIKWHEITGGCDKKLDGDARFCTSCGSTSTFYEEGLLISWEDEQKIKEDQDRYDLFDNSADPFADPTKKQLIAVSSGIIDGEIPF